MLRGYRTRLRNALAAKNVIENCDRALAIEHNDKMLIAQARQLKAVALQDLGQKDPAR